mmetsp:Transcript_148083/g.258335  ORF Transcript_148083/g.258335 Transcript_148083/m.258335 type:complete len:308 (+) Transcript_148083:133-1056(+)
MTASAAIASPVKAISTMTPVEPPPGLEHLAGVAAVSNRKAEQQRRRPRGQETRSEKWKKKQSEKIEKSVPRPPGLEFPPGLEEPLESSTTASNNSSNSPSSPMYIKSSLMAPESLPVHRVQISGLPNAILSHLMLEAVLQQAQLSTYVVTFTTKPGKVSGEAVVTLVSEEAAECCVQHFQGCHWDASGAAVCARYLPPAGSKVAVPAHNKIVAALATSRGMSAEAAEFQPLQVGSASQKTDLSVDAPIFMPGALTSSMFEAPMLCAEAPAFIPKKNFVTSSDVSTEDLGSESDEDKECVSRRQHEEL